MRPNGYLYPPAKKRSNEDIVCCVVEKTGDETRTSMRQSEIYAYSPSIRIRDGYMVMPKWHWNAYKQGDWFLAKPSYAVGSHEEERDERELTNLRKINPTDYAKYKIPLTRVEFGFVQIKCPFVVCPEWIQNRETRNANGTYRKLLLLDIGQGFVCNNNRAFKNLSPGETYMGIFEFRAKDNGACNFSHRSIIRDETNHVYERDAMWELMEPVHGERGAKKEHIFQMKEWLEKLKKDAEEFDTELEQRGVFGGQRRMAAQSLLENPREDDPVNDVTMRTFGLSLSESNRSQRHSFVEQSHTESLHDQRHSLAAHPGASENTHEFNSVVELENHRSRTIILVTCIGENGEKQEKWYDRETQQSATEPDFLHWKFNSRHKVAVQSLQPTVAPSVRRHTISESSIRAYPGRPVATSTPRPSPPHSPPAAEASYPNNRRFFEDSQYRTINAEEEETDENHDTLNETSNTTLMLHDNNANPIYRPPYMHR
ncbi:unnamed protein product [Caenorhabditis nigoni]